MELWKQTTWYNDLKSIKKHKFIITVRHKLQELLENRFNHEPIQITIRVVNNNHSLLHNYVQILYPATFTKANSSYSSLLTENISHSSWLYSLRSTGFDRLKQKSAKLHILVKPEVSILSHWKCVLLIWLCINCYN